MTTDAYKGIWKWFSFPESLTIQEEKENEDYVNGIAIMRPMPYSILATMRGDYILNRGS